MTPCHFHFLYAYNSYSKVRAKNAGLRGEMLGEDYCTYMKIKRFTERFERRRGRVLRVAWLWCRDSP